MTRDQCQQIYRVRNLPVTENMVCASAPGKDSCFGDSGGALLDASTGVLEGVVSWGLGCADQQFPAVYAAVGRLYDFISREAGQLPGGPGGDKPANPGGNQPTNPDDTQPTNPDGNQPTPGGNPPTNPDNGGNVPFWCSYFPSGWMCFSN